MPKLDIVGFLLLALTTGFVGGCLGAGIYLGPLGPLVIVLGVMGMAAFVNQWRTVGS